MLNKEFILSICIVLLTAGCKIVTVPFSYNKNVNKPLFNNIIGLLRNDVNQIDSIKVYKAILEDALVERDAIPEYKLVNPESHQQVVELAVNKNHHELYFFQLFTKPVQDELCVFLSTSYNPKNQCTKIGPAYLGNIRMEQVNMKRELAVYKQNDQYYFKDVGPHNIIFYAANSFPVAIDGTCNDDASDETECKVQIMQIINREKNKIGGNKDLIFDTEKIFNDARALVFKYDSTIK